MKVGISRQIQLLKTIREDKFIGNVISVDSNAYVFRLKNKEEIRFDASDVTSITVLSKKDIWPRNAVYRKTERLMMLPNGFMLKRGELEYLNQMIAANNLNYGITDRYNTGAGLFLWTTGQLTWADLKMAMIQHDWIHWASGVFFGYGRAIGISHEDYRIVFPFTSLSVGHHNQYINFSVARGMEANGSDAEWISWKYSLSGKIYGTEKSGILLEINNVVNLGYRRNLLVGYSHKGKKSSYNLCLLFYGEVKAIPGFTYSRLVARK